MCWCDVDDVMLHIPRLTSERARSRNWDSILCGDRKSARSWLLLSSGWWRSFFTNTKHVNISQCSNTNHSLQTTTLIRIPKHWFNMHILNQVQFLSLFSLCSHVHSSFSFKLDTNTIMDFCDVFTRCCLCDRANVNYL